ncbi:MAG: hypothetical protein AAGK02_05215 [Pseudomonadota bacterium]
MSEPPPSEENTPVEPTNAVSNLPVPSTNPSTNLLIADIVLRGASSLFRKSVQKKVAKANFDDAQVAEEVVDGRAILTTLALYGASKLATRSAPGLAIVAGGLVLKTLYDRGKVRELRTRRTVPDDKAEAAQK